MSDTRIVAMQQIAVLQDGHGKEAAFSASEITALEGIQQEQKRRAEAELAQAFADGYEIADVTVGGDERVLLTVWTLRLVAVRAADIEGDDARSALARPVESRALLDASQVPQGFFPVRSPSPDEQAAIHNTYLERADLFLRTLKP